MATMTLGVFSDRESADAAVNDLDRQGFSTNEISIVMRDTVISAGETEQRGAHVVGGAASGATTGGVLGGLAGLLIGLGAIAIPGVGALLIGGPIAAALGLTGAAATTISGAITGALAGGLVGALVGLGVPEETAQVYEDQVRAGGVLLAVSGEGDRGATARRILEEHGADQIRTVNVNNYRES